MSINELPPGGHTIEGFLARNPDVAALFKALEDDAAAKAAEHDGAFHAHQHATGVLTQTKSDYANLVAAYSRYDIDPGSREAHELSRAAEAVERAKALVQGRTGPALERANERSGSATEVLRNATRFLAGRKTENTLKLRSISAGLTDGVSFPDAIATKSATLAARKVRRGAVATARPPAEGVKRTFRNRVADAAARGEPEITGLDDGGRNIGFSLPMMMMHNVEPNKFRPSEQPRVVDMMALACRYFGDKIIADLEAQVDAAYAGELGDEVLDASEKRTMLAALDREIDQIQRELAKLIWLARDAGQDIDFPSDLPAAAILGVNA